MAFGTPHRRHLKKVGVLGSYLPRQCGIATFTSDVVQSLRMAAPHIDVSVIALNDSPQSYDYPEEVRFAIEQTVDSYRRAADYINASELDVLFIQHEFGLFAGAAGAMLFELLDNIRIPVVTLLHTILKNPDEEQFRVTRRLAARSSELITMSDRGAGFLDSIYEVDSRKVTIIPHGIPDMPFVDGDFYKDEFGLLGRRVGLTFGLLSPGKGIEYAIDAVPEIVAANPDFMYVLLGATHPHLLRQEGERYRESLMTRIRDLGVEGHVQFVNRFVDIELLKKYIAAADVYLTPYLNETQITSGTLSYAYGCGKPIVSTPYWHAADLLADGRGELVPFRDSAAISEAVNRLFADDALRLRLRKNAYQEGRRMIWSAVGADFIRTLNRANNQMFNLVGGDRPTAVSQADDAAWVLDPQASINLSHLQALSDDTGIIQHATYSTPNWHEGYCTDDNTRALLLTLYLDQLDEDSQPWRLLQRRYAAFLEYAVDPQTKSLRNFMSFDRRWLESRGSNDSLGRTLWTLGYCVGKAINPQLRCWATRLWEMIADKALECDSPRCWAFAILGAAQYNSFYQGERRSIAMIEELAGRLMARYEASSLPDWLWYERILTYDNAQLPHAMLRAGHACSRDDWSEVGLKSLRWLCELQTAPAGHFQPIGNHGFFAYGQERAVHDQQPLEAWSTSCATLAAFELTGDASWYEEAIRAVQWFLGKNDLGQPLADWADGSCCDGLQFDRVNRNQGAESTLAWLCAIAELRLAQRTTQHGDERVVPPRQTRLPAPR